MTLAEKPAEFRGKGQRCLILTGKQLLKHFTLNHTKSPSTKHVCRSIKHFWTV